MVARSEGLRVKLGRREIGLQCGPPGQGSTLFRHPGRAPAGEPVKSLGIGRAGADTQNNDLSSVAATSATDAWAAGDYDTGTGTRTLVLHWDGSAWTQVTTPNLGGSTIDDSFTSVGASSAGSVWAVGRYYNGAVDQTFAIHCC
jgi:hypothetical protein